MRAALAVEVLVAETFEHEAPVDHEAIPSNLHTAALDKLLQYHPRIAGVFARTQKCRR